MNRRDVLEQLLDALADISIHSKLLEEMLSICAESGVEAKFVSMLISRLGFLAQSGVLATRHKEFEPIGSGLYSMHIAVRGGNIRILFGFLPDRSPALLLCFHERAGKSRTDYSSYIPVALRRLEECKRGV